MPEGEITLKRKQISFTRLLTSCVVLVLVAAGCFQGQVDGGLQSDPVSQLLPTDTPIPTNTDSPESPTPSPTKEDIVATETPEPTQASVQNVGATSIAQAPTETPDEFAIQATQLILQLTVTAEFEATATALALGIGSSPTPSSTPTIEGVNVPTQAPAVPGANCVHEVRSGETLFRLSLNYGVPVVDIANASGVTNVNIISIGQRLTIPGCGTTGFLPPATSTPSPTPTPIGFGTDPNAQGAGVATPAPPLVARTQYTVRQYDTLFSVALANNTTVDDIARLNGITNINVIKMGDVLQIP